MKEPSPGSENTCKTFAEHISAYFDGQLTGEFLETIEAHLRQCPHCARQLEHYTLFRNAMNAEHRNCPVDLSPVVMAGLERDHLLQGLETLSKPPTPRWVKLVRAFSAAAMLALIASAGLIIMYFTGNTHQSSRLADRTVSPAIQSLDPTQQSAVPQREFALGMSPEKDQNESFDTSLNSSESSDDLNNSDESEAPSEASRISKRSLFAKPDLSGNSNKKFAKALLSTTTAPAEKMQYLGSQPPLVLQPSPVRSEQEQLSMSVTSKSRGLSWPVKLVYELDSSDLPGWMLLKEQVFIALMENHVPVLSESWQVAEALEKNQEFFYQAKKGLDLPPGSRSAQILLVTQPETFDRIHASLQQAMSDTIRRRLSPELENYSQSRTITAELVNAVETTFAALDRAFGVTPSNSETILTTQATQPASPVTVLTTLPASTSCPTTGTAATTTQVASTRPTLTLLPVLIKIEVGEPTPTTTTAAATNQSTQP